MDDMDVTLKYGMLPAGVVPLQGEDLRKWADRLPTIQSLRNENNLQRKMQDENAAVTTIVSALKTWECSLLPVVAALPDGSVHNWMHVASQHLDEVNARDQAVRDQQSCTEYIEETLRNYDVRFEFVRDPSAAEGFQIQVLTNW